jgi:heme A synthase
MVGGVKYEHGHRMFAGVIGILLLVMAIWTQRAEQRRWMKMLAWIAIASWFGQAILGGLTVLWGLPWYISTGHATLAQTLFSAVVAMALFTSGGWLQEAEPIAEADLTPNTSALTILSVACVWVQLILGAAFRHTGIKLLPHIVGACVVTAMLCWTVVRVLTRYNRVAQLRRPAQLILAMLMVQLGLGFASYVSRLIWMLNPPQPTTWIVLSTVLHVAGGAIVLAATVVLAIQAHRVIRVGGQERLMTTTARKAVAA